MSVSIKVRKSLPASRMGLPAENKYPMPDSSHAANAKARATQQVSAGNLTPSQKNAIDRKADAILHPNALPAHAFHKGRGIK